MLCTLTLTEKRNSESKVILVSRDINMRVKSDSVNLDTQMADIDGQSVHLTGKEYGILELLSLRKGTTLTKEMF